MRPLHYFFEGGGGSRLGLGVGVHVLGLGWWWARRRLRGRDAPFGQSFWPLDALRFPVLLTRRTQFLQHKHTHTYNATQRNAPKKKKKGGGKGFSSVSLFVCFFHERKESGGVEGERERTDEIFLADIQPLSILPIESKLLFTAHL